MTNHEKRLKRSEETFIKYLGAVPGMFINSEDELFKKEEWAENLKSYDISFPSESSEFFFKLFMYNFQDIFIKFHFTLKSFDKKVLAREYFNMQFFRKETELNKEELKLKKYIDKYYFEYIGDFALFYPRKKPLIFKDP